MRARTQSKSLRCARRGSVLVIVLWIAFGLVSLALYFANSMNFELRAADNRVCAMAADQAIEGAVRYLNYLLVQQIANGSNGVFLNLDGSLCQNVPVGEAHYWLIGRDTNNPVGPGRLCFGLVDEASKLNLNMAAINTNRDRRQQPAHLAAAHDGGSNPGHSRLGEHQRQWPHGYLLHHAAAVLPVQVRAL
jgi:type II secretory pathway component PulK